MSWVAVGVAGAGLVIKGVGAYSQARKAKKGLEALGQQPYPEYQVSPELQGAYSRAQGMAKQGFSAEETAARNQDVARSQTAQARSAVDMGGGNMARTINAGLQGSQIQGINQFAAQGAQLKRQNIRYADDLASALQQQKNIGTQAAIQKRVGLEQAYGGSLAQANENFYGAVNDASSIGVEGAQRTATNRNAQLDRENDLEIAKLQYGT